jgi:hypothetical protein
LLEQHVAKHRIRLVDPDGVHKLLDVVIHLWTLDSMRVGRTSFAR